MPPPPRKFEPIFGPYEAAAMWGMVGAIPGGIIGIAAEPLLYPEQTAHRNTINGQINTLRGDIATQQAELNVLQRQGMGRSSFATFVRDKIGEQQHQTTVLQREVRPFEHDYAVHELGAVTLGFVAASGLAACWQLRKRWQRRRAESGQN